jgi:hypothetical protein
MRRFLVAAFAVSFVADLAHAQGALSTSGLGFPPGQLSARAEGTGGGVADFDPLSLTSPSAIAAAGAAAVFFQYSPEFRKVTAGSGIAKNTIARFPLVSGVLPLGQSWTAGLSSSTFLDRSYVTSLVRRENIGAPADTFDVTERTQVLGAINDERLAVSWAKSPAFRVGIGAHVFAGSNRVTLSSVVPDTTPFLGATQSARVSYAGFAGSVGVELRPSRVIGFALSGRKGGDLTAQSNDSVIGRARLPDHYSASVTYEGITGAILSGRVAHDSWSSLGGLTGSSVQAFDGWDSGVGAEVTGPRILQRQLTLRAGARMRTLPFSSNGEKVSETAFMAGFGAPLTRDRASLDFAFQRAARSTSNANERGFIFSFGLRVSP